MCGFISWLFILFHQSICLCLCQYHAILITVDLWYCLRSWEGYDSWFVVFLQDWFGNSGLLCFCINFMIICSSLLKNILVFFLIGITWYLQIAFGILLTGLILLNPRPWDVLDVFLFLWIIFSFLYQCFILYQCVGL